MHKMDLAAKVARRTDLDDRATQKILNMFLEEISASLKKGKSVTLTGFGTFVVQKNKKRQSHDIQSGDMITIPAHKRVRFIVGLPLRKLVRG